MKHFYSISLLTFCATLITAWFLPTLSFASTSNPGGGAILDPTLEFTNQLCEFRKMFCGTGAVVLISVTATFVGILTLMNKINWGFTLVMIATCIIFVNADKVAFLITEEEVDCSCT